MKYPTAFFHEFCKNMHVHVAIAQIALGTKIPNGACVHHVDGNVNNNIGKNLVICPSQSYHKLLHKRERALNSCGHADWLKCVLCKQYDSPENIKVRTNKTGATTNLHLKCAREYDAKRLRLKRPIGWVWIPGSQGMGKKRSAEHAEKMKKIHIGRKCSQETIAKMRAAALKRERDKKINKVA